MKTEYILGLDLAESKDFTALAIVEKETAEPPRPSDLARLFAAYVPDPPPKPKPSYACRYLKRWQQLTPYEQIAVELAELLKQPPLKEESPILAVDKTGVGAGVVALFRAAKLPVKLRPVTITGGSAVTKGDHGAVNVPKKDLVGVLQVLMQSGRLKIAELPERKLLVEELEKFRVKVKLTTGNETFEAWRERDHDDIVLALAIACWMGDKGTRTPDVW